MPENNNETNNKNGLLIIVLLAVVTVLVLLFPKIYDFINSFSMPEVENTETKEKEETKELDESILETIHYPLMRTSIYNSNTYYSLDKFTINDLTNEDILLNAFLDLYEGNITSYEGYSCTGESKQFSKDYMELRIKNIIGNKINYSLNSFYVPEDLDSKYVGNWTYDSYNGRFIYEGLCSSNASNIKYYDLEELIKVEYENKKDIAAYYYVGFAKVEGENYIIYKDANMNEKLDEGKFIDKETLINKFKSINKNKKSTYKYLFKNNLCSYNEYCLYEGKWVNEL